MNINIQSKQKIGYDIPRQANKEYEDMVITSLWSILVTNPEDKERIKSKDRYRSYCNIRKMFTALFFAKCPGAVLNIISGELNCTASSIIFYAKQHHAHLLSPGNFEYKKKFREYWNQALSIKVDPTFEIPKEEWPSFIKSIFEANETIAKPDHR